jgi:hypothetical protein
VDEGCGHDSPHPALFDDDDDDDAENLLSPGDEMNTLFLILINETTKEWISLIIPASIPSSFF